MSIVRHLCDLGRRGLRLVRRTGKDRRGGVAVVVAIALPVLLGGSALAVEYSQALAVQVEDQRVADAAAVAGALAYNANSTTSAMTNAAGAAASLNGMPANASVTAVMTTSPSGDGNQAVQVTVVRPQAMYLATLFGQSNTLNVTSISFAELQGGTPGCIIALSGAGAGVSVSGGAKVTANACSVSSNAAINATGGGCITTKAVTYNSSTAPTTNCSPAGVVAPTGSTLSVSKKSTSDPLSGNAGVAATQTHLAVVAALGSPTGPSVPAGTAVPLGYSPGCGSSSPCAINGTSCHQTQTGDYSGNWTITCTNGSTNNYFSTISVGGGVTLNFSASGSASTVYDFSTPLNVSGGSVTFGPGTYNMAQGLLMTSGGGTLTFGAGTYNIGQSTTACADGAFYSICNEATLTIAGPSTFVLSGGIYNGGGDTLSLGAGTTTNCFQIGRASNGNGFYAGGGAKTIFGDATGACAGTTPFTMNGNFNDGAGGGSCTQVSVAAQHDINGYFSTAGGVTLGAGVYTVNGYVALGAAGGGDVSCWGTTLGMSGVGVTFVVSGATLSSSGNCNGEAFCVGAGYGHVTLTAPSSGTTANLVVVGPQSPSNTGGAAFGEGASNTSLSGVFYFPNGAVTLSGAGSIGNGSGQCLELIGSQVSLSGGSAAASTCVTGSGGASGSTVKLVR